MFSKGDILNINDEQYTVIYHKSSEVGKFEMILWHGIWEEEKPGVWIERMLFKRSAIKEYLEMNPGIGSGCRGRKKECERY